MYLSNNDLVAIMAGHPMRVIIAWSPMTWCPMRSIRAGRNDARGKACGESQAEQDKFDLFHDSKFRY